MERAGVGVRPGSAVRLPSRRAAAWCAVGAAVVVAASALAAVPAGSPDRPSVGGRLAAAESTYPLADTTAPTRLRIASFNLLGAGHTDAGGDRPGWAPSSRRTRWAVKIIQQQELDVIGFQEMQEPQVERFRELARSEFGLYPGRKGSLAAMQNSIAWRRDEWQLVRAETIPIPYFDGNRIRMPYVLLRNRETGRQAWFFNSHNPADARGPAEKWRRQGFAMEADLVNRLREQSPTTPVFSTGDKNELEDYYCPVAGSSPLRAPHGGSVSGSGCNPPERMNIDWVMGTSEVAFTNFRPFRDALVRKTTDHPVVMADASIPAVEVVTSPIRRVVVVSVEGLASRALTRHPDQATTLRRLIERGASTLDARTSVERTTRLPNLVGMVTGRPVDPSRGGHGAGWDDRPDDTVAAAAGHYVSSAFDLVHNFGGRTVLTASHPDAALLDRSWNAANGALDPHGTDNGRDKIDDFDLVASDRAVVDSLTSALQRRPPRLAVAELTGLDAAGHRDGWLRPGYVAALRQADRLVGRVAAAIAADPTLARTTLLVVTSEHGGRKRSHGNPRRLTSYRVPLIVSGPGVPAGADLYDLNPTYARPGEVRVGYDAAAQPLRNLSVANLVTTMLGLPPIPGAGVNSRQDFTVLSTR